MTFDSLELEFEMYALFIKFSDAATCARTLSVIHGEPAGVRSGLRGWYVLLSPAVRKIQDMITCERFEKSVVGDEAVTNVDDYL